MARFKQYEHLPWWLSSLDHNTLTPTEKEILNLDYYCKKFGTKLSHQAAADHLHRSKRYVQLRRRRLEQLGLRRTESAKGSFKLGRPIEYPNERAFLDQLEGARVPRGGALKAPKSSRRRTLLRRVSSSKVAEPPPKTPAEKEKSTASIAGRLNGLGSGRPTAEPAGQSVRDACTWKVYYLESLSKLKKTIKDPERAKRIARVTADNRLEKSRRQDMDSE